MKHSASCVSKSRTRIALVLESPPTVPFHPILLSRLLYLIPQPCWFLVNLEDRGTFPKWSFYNYTSAKICLPLVFRIFMNRKFNPHSLDFPISGRRLALILGIQYYLYCIIEMNRKYCILLNIRNECECKMKWTAPWSATQFNSTLGSLWACVPHVLWFYATLAKRNENMRDCASREFVFLFNSNYKPRNDKTNGSKWKNDVTFWVE